MTSLPVVGAYGGLENVSSPRTQEYSCVGLNDSVI